MVKNALVPGVVCLRPIVWNMYAKPKNAPVIAPVQRYYKLNNFHFLKNTMLKSIAEKRNLTHSKKYTGNSSRVFFNIKKELPHITALEKSISFAATVRFVSVFI